MPKKGTKYAADIKPDGKVQKLDPHNVRFSQKTIGDEWKDYADKMAKTGTYTAPPADVVKMEDGQLTTMDNRRTQASRAADVKMDARVHNYDDPIPEDLARQITKPGQVQPKTWGDAIRNRISGQGSYFSRAFPFGRYGMPPPADGFR